MSSTNEVCIIAVKLQKAEGVTSPCGEESVKVANS